MEREGALTMRYLLVPLGTTLFFCFLMIENHFTNQLVENKLTDLTGRYCNLFGGCILLFTIGLIYITLLFPSIRGSGSFPAGKLLGLGLTVLAELSLIVILFVLYFLNLPAVTE